MNYNLGRNQASNVRSSIKEEIERKQSMAEVPSSTREARLGYRGGALVQLNRISGGTEGQHIIGVGGPPIVGI